MCNWIIFLKGLVYSQRLGVAWQEAGGKSRRAMTARKKRARAGNKSGKKVPSDVTE